MKRCQDSKDRGDMRLTGTAFVKATEAMYQNEIWINLAQVTQMRYRVGRTELEFSDQTKLKVKETPEELLAGGKK